MIAAVTAGYSDEQLRAAWLACKRATWPPTFEQAMADATYSRLVRLNAWLLARPRKRPAQMYAQAQRSAAPAHHHFSAPPGWVDHKRAASGDRDD